MSEPLKVSIIPVEFQAARPAEHPETGEQRIWLSFLDSQGGRVDLALRSDQAAELVDAMGDVIQHWVDEAARRN
jgi:hypothetical protein